MPESEAEWQKFLWLTAEQNFAPAAHRYIQDHGLSDRVPELVLNVLSEGYILAQARYLKKLAELQELQGALHGAGIKYVVIKGLAIASQLYSDPGIRLSQDIDLLFEWEDVEKVEAIVADLGYGKRTTVRTHEEYRKYHQGYGDVMVQLNVEDTRLGVAEYVVEKLGVETIELKWGQGAKCIGGEIKVDSLERAIELSRRGYIVTPDPNSKSNQQSFKDKSIKEFERHSRVGFLDQDDFMKEVDRLASCAGLWV